MSGLACGLALAVRPRAGWHRQDGHTAEPGEGRSRSRDNPEGMDISRLTGNQVPPRWPAPRSARVTGTQVVHVNHSAPPGRPLTWANRRRVVHLNHPRPRRP